MSALQCCELLAKSQVFQKQASTSAEESKNRAKKKSHGIDHAGGRIAFRLWTATSHPVEIKGEQNFGKRQGNNSRVGFLLGCNPKVLLYCSKPFPQLLKM